MSYFDFMFLTIICALNTSILIVVLILINHIDSRTLDIKEMMKELTWKPKEAVVRCKDCVRYEQETGRCKNKVVHGNAETWFCADGERKDSK